MTDNENKPAAALSIDTPEFRELLGKIYKRTSYSYSTPNAETKAVFAHIDEKLNSINESFELEREHLRQAVQNVSKLTARAEKAEAQLAAIRAGVEGLDTYQWTPEGMDIWDDGDFIYRGEALALLNLEKPE